MVSGPWHAEMWQTFVHAMHNGRVGSRVAGSSPVQVSRRVVTGNCFATGPDTLETYAVACFVQAMEPRPRRALHVSPLPEARVLQVRLMLFCGWQTVGVVAPTAGSPDFVLLLVCKVVKASDWLQARMAYPTAWAYGRVR